MLVVTIRNILAFHAYYHYYLYRCYKYYTFKMYLVGNASVA